MVLIKNIKKNNNESEIPECPICFNEIDCDPSQLRETITDNFSGEANNAQRRLLENDGKLLKKCMMTPCKHYYHPDCLKQWMDQKMECPSCRAA